MLMNGQGDIPLIEQLDVTATPRGHARYYWLKWISDGFGSPINIPVIIARGVGEGPVLGVTAAVHGNELNGVPVIQRIFKEINIAHLKGTIVGVPVVKAAEVDLVEVDDLIVDLGIL